MKFLLKTFLIFGCCLPAFAQNFTVSGTISDTKTGSAVPGATIRLIALPDSTIRGAIANGQGNFEVINVVNGRYVLKVSSIGYGDYTRSLTVSGESLQLGRIALKEENVTTDEVEVIGRRATSQQKGDTTELDASAFKTNRDANSEDLVQKIPGVTMQDGKVQAQGEEVKQVLVDGKPFFGDDPTAALRNLPAEVVDRVQIFDEQDDQSRFSGFNNGNTKKTMNIVTKPNMRSGQFGRFNGGYGNDNRYRAAGNLSIFNGVQRISILAQTNNINEQNFSSEDLVGAMGGGSRGGGGMRGGGRMMMRGGGGMRGGGMMGGDIGEFLVPQRGGITQSHALGLNYSDTWADNITVTGSYFTNLGDNTNDQESFRQYVLPSDSGQSYQEKNLSDSRNINHRFNFKFDYDIDSLNSFVIRPRFSLQQNNGTSKITAETMSEGALLNQLNNDFSSDLTGINFSNNATYSHRFETRGRSITLGVNTNYNSNSGTSDLVSDNRFFTQNFMSDTLHQFSDLNSNGWGNTTRLNYTEPIDTNNMLQFSYTNSYTLNTSDKQTLDDSLDGGQPVLNTALSNTFENRYMTNAAGAGYRYQNGGLQLMLDASYQIAQLNNDQSSPQRDPIQRTFKTIMPSAMLRYSISQDKNLRLFYRTNTNPPSVNQLQNVINNTNPVQLSRGNPDLAQTYQHNLFTHYSAADIKNATSFFAMIGGSYAQDYIGNSTFIAARDTVVDGVQLLKGSQLTQPENLDGYYSLRSFISYGMPFDFLKSNLNVNLMGTLTRTPGRINNEMNFSNSPSLMLGLVLGSNISEDLDFTISSNSTFSAVSNTLQTSLDNEYFNQSTGVRFNWIFWEGFSLQTDVNHQFNSGLSQGFNQNYVLWNASLGKKFLKDNQAELRISAFDLLKQNNSIQRNVTDVYIEDTRSDVLQQYFMLQFTYNLRNFTKSGE